MKSRYPFNRKYNQTKHATYRSKTRYGFEASPAILLKIADAIVSGKAECLSAERNVYRVDCSSFIDHHQANRIVVAFDHPRRNVRTFLPVDWTVAKADAWDEAKVEARKADGWMMSPAKAKKLSAKASQDAARTHAMRELDDIVEDFIYVESYDDLSVAELTAERDRIKHYREDRLKPLIITLTHSHLSEALQARLGRSKRELGEVNHRLSLIAHAAKAEKRRLKELARLD